MNKITIIYAVNKLGFIGKGNDLPWHSKTDLQRFKELTTGNVVIMGRNTWESLPRKPLKDRVNIVVTSTDILENPSSMEENEVITTRSLEDALVEATDFKKDIFLIGGKRIFEEGMNFANTIDITWIDDYTMGDVSFTPKIKPNEWVQIEYNTFDDGYYERYKRVS